MNHLIEVARFSKDYAGTRAVDELSFHVRPGDVLGMVGPNGAGKTTTLRALAGVVKPTAGGLSVCGLDVRREPTRAKRSLAYVPDDPPLFPDLTVEQHLAFTASAYEVDDAASRAEALLREFDLVSKRHELAANLSRGMRQKLAVCCAYLHDPPVVLFDEPLTGLDPVGIRTLTESIRRRAAAGGAVVVSSHLLAMVEEVCTHALILDHGRRRFFGTLAELRASFMDEGQATTLERLFFRATAATTIEHAAAP